MSKQTRYSLFFAILGAVFYIPFLGGVHLFDWDEINFAEISREMIVTGEYLRVYVDFEAFFQKPPFFFWTQVLSMRLFGITDFAARFPNAVCGVITLVILYNMGRRLRGHRFGFIWTLVYFGTVLPFLYFKSGIIDPFFNLFIFIGLYFFILFHWKKQGKQGIHLPKHHLAYLFLAGFFVGMGILTKGPVAYMVTIFTMGMYWIYQRFRFYINVPEFLLFTVATTLVSLTWYGIETLKNGPEFIIEFNKYQWELFSTPSAGHKGFPGYHFIVLLLGCFPASVFALRSFAKFHGTDGELVPDLTRWMKYFFWVVLILFTIVESKIVHYSSLCYFPLTYLAAHVILKIRDKQIRFLPWMRWTLIGIAALYMIPILAMPYLGMHPELLIDLIDDPFARGNLEANVRWTGWEILPACLLAGILFTGIRWMRRDRFDRGLAVLFGGTAVFVMTTLVFFIGRIEGYSQRAAVEFFEERADEDCHTVAMTYKSYVHLWYARKKPQEAPRYRDKEWLLHGDIDKPVYISARKHKAGELYANPELEVVEERNGFVFFRRVP